LRDWRDGGVRPVEIAVRETANLPATLVGVKLMRCFSGGRSATLAAVFTPTSPPHRVLQFGRALVRDVNRVLHGPFVDLRFLGDIRDLQWLGRFADASADCVFRRLGANVRLGDFVSKREFMLDRPKSRYFPSCAICRIADRRHDRATPRPVRKTADGTSNFSPCSGRTTMRNHP
jgi:hypothetical protein